MFLSFSKINDCKTKVSWVKVIPENSFLRKFFHIGITFHFTSSIILSNIITEKYNIKNTSLRSSYNEKKINLFLLLGRGVTSQIKDRTNILILVHDSDLPDSRKSKALYENTYRWRLMDLSRFGRDPLEDIQELKQRRQGQFFNRFVISIIFKECVNNRPRMLQNAILFFIQLSQTLI